MNNVTEQETNTLNQQQGPPTSGSNEEGNQQQATIASLTAQVTELQSSVSQIVTAMKALPIFQDPPAPPPAVPNTHAPPPHFQPNPYQPPTNSEFEYLARLEPLKIKDLWFSGDSDQLVSFLRHIRDFLRLRSTLFQSESRKVIWISRHFGWQPSEHKKRPSDTENWYNALLIENARQQGKVDAYGDLDGVEFQHKYLLSVTAFLDRLIFIFGDRFRKENAKRALAQCKQKNSTIGEYNSQFKSLVYLVNDMDDVRIEKYVAGLNPRIIRQAMNNQRWMDEEDLDAKMEMASRAAAQVDLLAGLPPEPVPGTPLPPLASHRPGAYPPQRQQRDPNAMEIDSTQTFPLTKSLLDSSRAICRARKLCFRCLAPIVPGVHTGSLNCPNPGVPNEKRQALVNRCQQNSPASVSSIQAQNPNPPLTYRPNHIPTDPSHFPSPAPPHVQPESTMDNHFQSAGFDELYEDYGEDEDETAQIPVKSVSTVQVRLDNSQGGRLLVPLAFRAPGGTLVPATVLVDTGAMANFVNERFVRQHDLTLRQRKVPIQCVGFDGSQGVGGLVTQDWVGMVQLSKINSEPFHLKSSFGVTRLGSVDAIFGLPWLNRQGFSISGSLKGGHVFTIGSTPIYVMDFVSQGGQPEGTEVFSAQLSPPLKLPPEFERFADVFSPQMNCKLPPHRSMDISINLKEGATPPFGGLYNLSFAEQQQLKLYIDENLKKGFIRLSSSSAAAPIFFVRVPGKKPRPCVDYRGLNSMTIRDSYPIPIVGQLLNQLQGCRFFTKIDLKSAFNLLRVAEGHEWKTAFRTPWGLYEYLVMPFGLANAPACFQRFIQFVLREFLSVSCFVYIDDILIFSKTREEHQRHVTEILEKLKENSLFASPEKCSFYSDKVSFLGFSISDKGIKMESDKLTPLTSLTKQRVDVATELSSAKCLASFQSLKDSFKQAPLLQHFDFAKTRTLHVDSSKYALSAVLSQPDENGKLRPVSFLSKKWNENEASWQCHDQELGAIVQAFVEWRAWLIDTNEPVLVLSDHANLIYFSRNQNLSDRQARWASYLSSFHFVIKHIPGRLNPADPATRRPDYMPANDEKELQKPMMLKTHSGFTISGASLDEVDERIDQREVTHVCDINNEPPREEEEQDHANIIDTSFCAPSQRLKDMLKAAYEADPPDAEEEEDTVLEFRDELWWYRDRIFVPTALRAQILKTFHDEPTAGHPGSLKTLDIISRCMNWPGIRKDVIEYTKSCFSCQRAKHSNQKPPGLMNSLSVPSRPWSIIAIDFIVKLPISGGFDSILVVVDHFSKGVHLIPAKETWNSEEFAFAFLDRVIRLHGLPDKIVSDRGSTFLSKLWKEVQRLLRIKPAPSTAWHPRTDGQTERANQTVETFLRHFVSDRQDDWYHLLPIAELVFNNSVSASTGFSPFFSQYAFHPRINSLSEGSTVPAAEQFVTRLNDVQLTLQDNMKHAKEIQRKYFDQRTREAPVYKTGDWVWLLRRNIVSTRPSGKLDFKRLGPFKIESVIGNDAYRLILPADLSRIHPVFHTSLLLPYIDPKKFPNRLGSKAPRGPTSLNNPIFDEHDVEALLGYKSPTPTTNQYLVRWRGGCPADDSWVKGGLFSDSIHPYLDIFHELYGTDNIVLSLDNAVRILC
ncbi:hypothetical protein PSTT_14130 [Puccinia striiformis]|uniref:RNA-directed DNA polymerase n=1 Tax=Puccinia striiformis TaxID=27350 RepID=A0A2S4UNL1_9BASI|nr:hypothetical protein PSTT_14130 [Puccinia striiformis]